MRSILKDERTLARCHIAKMLLSQSETPHISFHTPGHKVNDLDITELSYSDNLSSPKGCIRAAQEDIAAILGAKQSFILTDGSTSGVYSMLKAAFDGGVKRVAAPLLSHKSFFNGCALLGLAPVLFEAPQGSIPLPVRLEDAEAALSGADALFLTSPDYYGNIPDLPAIAALCQRQGKPLLIDGAHGGHLHFTPALYAGTYADLWVDGVHKSLPALTQGAVVSAKTQAWGEKLKTAVDFFRTSSPSYPIMASVEYAVKYPRNLQLETLVHTLFSDCSCVRVSEEWTKLLLFVKNGFLVAKGLESVGVYPEFSDENLVCFYLSPATSAEELNGLKEAIRRLEERGETLDKKTLERAPAPQKLQNIAGKECEWIPLAGAAGRISAGFCGLFPPCLPLVFLGERIEEEKIARLQSATGVFGIENDKILVVKE